MRGTEKLDRHVVTQTKIPARLGLIIGAMKSGTTSLFHRLAQHPQVCPSSHKEPNYFASDENWAKGPAWYGAYWDWDEAQHQVGIEGSIHYTARPQFPNAAERIAQVSGTDFRFLYILRHPLDRIESHAMMAALSGWSPVIRQDGVTQHAVEISSYAMQLDAFVEHFDPDRILLLHLEDLAQQPAELLRRVCDFLAIDATHEFHSVEKRNKDRRQAVAGGDPPLFNTLNRGSTGRIAARLVPGVIKRPIKRWLMQRTDANCRLNEQQREQTLQRLLPDLRRLADEYGVDVEGRWQINLS